ncbi:MAG: aminoacyl--tRNA ligase-related protein [archaeon]|jgi:prolyl-tRNA synthetase
MHNKKILDFKDFASFLIDAEIIDNRYPVKGCYIWLPYGVAIKERLINIFKDPLVARDYNEYLFPRLVPKKFLDSLRKIVKSPEKGLFWVSNSMNKTENSSLFLYPTGEASIYSYFKERIKNSSDLPINLFQISGIYRPTKDTSILINGAESDTLLEVHTAHATEEESVEAFKESIKIMHGYYDKLLFPVFDVERPVWGNKPVAESTVSFETYLPIKNRSFSPSVTYHQSQVFSKAFEIKFKNRDGTFEYTYQNTFGIAERVLAAVFLLHMDEDGLRLPPLLAPVQIVIIPYFNGKDDEIVIKTAKELKSNLEKYRAYIDSREILPSKRIFSWRKKGVPICITINQNEIEKGVISISRRDLRKKEIIDKKNMLSWTEKALNEYSSALFEQAEKLVSSNTGYAKNITELQKLINNKKLAKICWCKEKDCGLNIESKVKGEVLGCILDSKPNDKCICGKEAKAIALYGQRCTSP